MVELFISEIKTKPLGGLLMKSITDNPLTELEKKFESDIL
jgi:hypothetical protein